MKYLRKLRDYKVLTAVLAYIYSVLEIVDVVNITAQTWDVVVFGAVNIAVLLGVVKKRKDTKSGRK